MRKTLALFVLLLAATAMVCQSSDDKNDDKDDSWADWAKGKLTGVFQGDQVKETAQNAANKAGDATSGSADYVSEKAVEAEDAAAEAAKKLSDKASGN